MSQGSRAMGDIPSGGDILSMFGGQQATNENTLPLDAIRLDGGTQPRAQLSSAMIDEYAEDLTNGATFPAVIVFYDGSDYWLADGFHRWHAHRKAGRDSILADIHQGDQRKAILHSVGVNADHGVRRTNADKRRAVLCLLNDGEWSGWANREIARRCKVAESTVRNIRGEIEGELSAQNAQIDEVSDSNIARDDVSVSAQNAQIDEQARPVTRKVERGGTVYEQRVSPKKRRTAQQPRPAPQPAPKPQRGPERFIVRDRIDLEQLFNRLEHRLADEVTVLDVQVSEREQ